MNGIEEVREVEREGEQSADGEASVDDERAPEAEDDRRRYRRQDVDGREVEAVQHDRLVVRRLVCLVHAAEARLARRLARERLHDAHSRDVLRERRGHEPEAFPDAPICAVRPHAEPCGRAAHQGNDEQRREREPPVDEKEHDRGAHEDEAVLDEARETVRHQLVERLDVVRDPAHDRAGSVPLEEAEREPLEVLEQADAEIRERALADPAREVGLRAGEHERCDAREQERDDDGAQRAQVPGGDSVVHGELHEERRQERDERVCDKRGDRQRRADAIRTSEAEEDAEPSPRLPPRPVFDAGGALVG